MLNKLNQVYEDFKENIGDKLCYLKCFKFTSDNIPDYNNEDIQRYYLLRFMLGYFCEYYIIYKTLIDMDFLANNYKILSIGCGCQIDFWGLKQAKQLHKQDIDINYTGLDIVEWLYMDRCGEGNVYFINQDIRELERLDEDDYNIIIFPKSIGEFDKITFNNLKKAIKNTNFTNNKLVLISSLRNSKIDYDIDRTIEIMNTLKDEHKYEPIEVEDLEKCKDYPKKYNGYDYRLEDIIDEFMYPQEIKDYITKLYTECQEYKDNNKCCEDDCKQILGRYPITTMSQMKFQIIRLERD